MSFVLTEEQRAFRDVMRELVGVGEDGAATRRYASLSRFPIGSPAREPRLIKAHG